jgi:hypothetical protein
VLFRSREARSEAEDADLETTLLLKLPVLSFADRERRPDASSLLEEEGVFRLPPSCKAPLRAIVEGRLRGTLSPGSHGFLAFEAWSASERETEPRRTGRRTEPRIVVETGDASIRIENQGYALREPLTGGEESAVEFRGLRPGDPVAVLGTIIEDPQGTLALRAEAMWKGRRADRLAVLGAKRRNLRNSERGQWLLGRAAAALILPFCFLWLIGWLRRLRQKKR